jgi:hypothetical protein
MGYWCHLRDLVIPAKAGIYSANLWKRAVVGLDSRFRGNDRHWVIFERAKRTGSAWQTRKKHEKS